MTYKAEVNNVFKPTVCNNYFTGFFKNSLLSNILNQEKSGFLTVCVEKWAGIYLNKAVLLVLTSVGLSLGYRERGFKTDPKL